MRGPSLVLSLTLAGCTLLAVSSMPAAAAPPSSSLSDARAHAKEGVLTLVNGDRRYRRAVPYGGRVAPYYAPRAYAQPYYNQQPAYYPPAAAYYAAPSAYYAAPPAYAQPPVQVIIIAPPSYASPTYVPPAYYENPSPAYYGYYSGNGYYDRGYYDRGYYGRYDAGYGGRW